MLRSDGPRTLAFGRWALALALALLPVAGGLAAQEEALVVRQLDFSGNKALDDVTLAAAISTTNSSFFATNWSARWTGLGTKRTFNEQEFRRDVERLQALYRRAGYREVAVDTVVRRTAVDVYISITIKEGEPLRLTSLALLGLDSVPEREQLVRDLPIAVGDVFSRFTLAAARDTILARLQDLGYPSSSALPGRFGEDVDGHVAQATLEFHTGPPAVFGPVTVTGQTRVDSGFIASLVSARPGARYRYNDLFRSQRALYASELFRVADVVIDTAQFSIGDTIVPLLVTVAEGRAHRARAAVGFATNDCFRVGLGWTARNFLGGGKLLDISTRLSKIGVGDPLDFGARNSICSPLRDDSVGSRLANYGLDVSLRRNGFLSPDNTLTTSLFAERRSEYKVFLREEVGAGVSMTRETAARIPITLSYRLSYGFTNANPASFCAFFNACAAADIAQLQQRRVLATVGLSAERVRVNNLLDPTRGSILTAEATVSSKLLGSSAQQQFTRVVGDASGFVPLTRSVTLAGHLRVGAVFSPKSDFSTGSGNFVPPEQRFYAGGPNDVRGYDRNELGPVVYVVPADSVRADDTFPASEARISATGGSRVVVANLELRLPSPIFSPRMRFAVFTDVGALWDQDGTARWRMTPGVGLRFASPLGPIRLDVGRNKYQLESGTVYTTTAAGDLRVIATDFVRPRPGKYTFHFSVGQAF
ncbi:MAG: BamA/TamA family outer membrane protein [Gemmatimonadales bacterium]|jgi:outer membrane protein assembly complex protein YaeT|nr:BamA/TamA family outer membrane protein [Gemmatimonadales bacterium]MBP6570702.1 BamA/TamA family outer membrane protein [Gemmatimonadales bacterium]MBP7619450.1 BamA/TamA family outer membrane protein [Gemmatimonadales bacterium]